jgi:hypothetical protein
MSNQKLRILAVAAITIIAMGGVSLLPRLHQDPEYHLFADHREFLGIANCLDVISNLPFLLVGIFGLRLLWSSPESSEKRMLAPEERWPWMLFFLGVGLTSFGSAYYHLAPGNGRLLWDRLPMALGFMSLLAAVIAERIEVRAGVRLLGPLAAYGIWSVLSWHFSELRGHGDLRPYILTQFFPLLLIPALLALFPAKYTRGGDLFGALGIYGLAKVFELLDARIFATGQPFSGHTLKHVTAAVATWWIYRMFKLRRPLAADQPRSR